MSAAIVVRSVSSEVEAGALVTYLKSLGIAAESRAVGVAGYPSTNDVVDILVDEVVLDRARELLREYDEAPVDPEELTEQALAATPTSVEPTRAGRTSKELVLFGGILASLVFNAYAALQLYVVPRLAGDVALRDTDGRVITMNRFRAGSENPHEVVAYDRDEFVIATWFDRDEDGWFESATFLSEDPSLSGVTHHVLEDVDHDGRMETTTVFASQQRLVRARDTNADDLADEWSHEESRARIVDSDFDGFPDRVFCRSAQNGEVEVSLRTCPPVGP